MHRDIRASFPTLAGLALSLALYAIIGAWNLSLPGLQYDEAADAVPALELLLEGNTRSAFSSIDLFGVRWPLMLQHYIGPTSIYTSLGSLWLFGATVEGLRAGHLLLGAFTLILLWLLTRLWFGDQVAAIATLLCATLPGFIFWSRSGPHFSLPLLPLALLTLLAFTRWLDSGRTHWLVAAALLFGAGFTTKVLFAWLLAPFALTALLSVGLPKIILHIRRIGLPRLMACGAAFTLGLAPFILHNLPDGASFRFIAENALQTQMYGHNNLDVFGNVSFEVADFLRLMSGDTLHFGAPAGWPLSAAGFIAAVIYGIARAVIEWVTARRRYAPAFATRDSRLRLFLTLCPLTMIPLATFSVSAIGARHLFILTPLVWMLIAVAIVDTASRLRFAQAATWLVVCVLAASQIGANISILSFLERTGARGLWSDGIYRLTDTLTAQFRGRPVVALDWGFERSVTFLTGGQIRMRELYEFLPVPSAQFAGAARQALGQPDNVYIAHAPGQAAFPRYRAVFERQAQLLHKQLRTELALTERDGAPYAEIITAAEMPRVFSVSPALATRNALFDDALTLLGGEMSYDAGAQEVALRLHWQALAANLPDDTVLVHVVNQNTGEVVHVADQQPFEGHYPFSRWMKGEVVTEPRWVALPAGLPPGIYQIRVGVYNTVTGERRRIHDPLNDAAGNSLMLDTFEIP